jgi:hypothetical protein
MYKAHNQYEYVNYKLTNGNFKIADSKLMHQVKKYIWNFNMIQVYMYTKPKAFN